MILRKATIKYAGYDPDELKPKSNKRICCSCDVCGRVRWLSKCNYYDLCHKCAMNTIEHRLNTSKITTKFFEDHPEARKEASKKSTEQWSSQENRDEMSKIKTDYWSNQENRDEQSERRIQYFENHPEARKELAKINTDRWCSQEIRDEHAKKISAAKQGVSLDKWRGFLTKKDARDLPEYKTWRVSVFKRDNYVCQLCQQRGGILNAHHIFKFSDYQELIFKINNGITLCVNCHTHKVNHHEKEYEIEFLSKIFDNKGIEIFGGEINNDTE